ncbi:MAG: 1-pyrroline-4-hydroxy-2-carboxylate deaminase (EC [uncultured Caballeronia sp.]|nr:MAG: 1-pyrroline-4-hydroxy-2-carboxylate deaminase (EC [uncultured Caballeronia sp.]
MPGRRRISRRKSRPAWTVFIVCGSLGEASTFSLDEKLDVLDIAVDATQGHVPVLLTIAENSTLDGCR